MGQTVLQITDCHLVRAGSKLLGMDTQASLEAVLTHAFTNLSVSGIVVTGDIAHTPQRAVYRRFFSTLKQFSDAPVLCLPGNHDVVAEMVAAGLPMAPLNLGAWSVVPLDSHIDDMPAADVSAQNCHDVREAMTATAARHCLLATHHPLVAINSPWLDRDRIQNAAELLDSLRKPGPAGLADKLRGIVFGHAHQEVFARLERLPLFGTPSTCFQFMPGSTGFTLDERPPGYRWLRLADNGRLSSDVCRVDFFPEQSK